MHMQAFWCLVTNRYVVAIDKRRLRGTVAYLWDLCCRVRQLVVVVVSWLRLVEWRESSLFCSVLPDYRLTIPPTRFHLVNTAHPNIDMESPLHLHRPHLPIVEAFKPERVAQGEERSWNEMVDALVSLFTDTKRVNVDEVKRVLASYTSDPKDWSPYAKFDPHR